MTQSIVRQKVHERLKTLGSSSQTKFQMHAQALTVIVRVSEYVHVQVL